jgi:hypothetical protein
MPQAPWDMGHGIVCNGTPFIGHWFKDKSTFGKCLLCMNSKTATIPFAFCNILLGTSYYMYHLLH